MRLDNGQRAGLPSPNEKICDIAADKRMEPPLPSPAQACALNEIAHGDWNCCLRELASGLELTSCELYNYPLPAHA